MNTYQKPNQYCDFTKIQNLTKENEALKQEREQLIDELNATPFSTFCAVQDLDSEALDNILYEDGLDWSYNVPDSKKYDIIYIFKSDEKLMDEELDKTKAKKD